MTTRRATPRKVIIKHLPTSKSRSKLIRACSDTLDKTKVTGIDQVDKIQDGVNSLVSGQVGQGGLLQPVGDLASKEGANRSERQGKGEDGSYIPGTDSASKAASGIAEGGKTLAGAAASGVQGVGGILGGALGGGAREQVEEDKGS